MIGRGCVKWGAECNIEARSANASFTMRYCSTSAYMPNNAVNFESYNRRLVILTPKMAFCRYRTPPWISFVDLEDVPLAKSSASTSAVFRPRVIESKATPAPVAPPPMTSTSYSSPLCNTWICSDRGGNFRFCRGVAMAAFSTTWS